jgi:hypothetical protein
VRFKYLIFRVVIALNVFLTCVHCGHPSYILGSCTSTVTLSVWLATAVLLGVVAFVGDIWDLLEVGDALLLVWLPRREP